MTKLKCACEDILKPQYIEDMTDPDVAAATARIRETLLTKGCPRCGRHHNVNTSRARYKPLAPTLLILFLILTVVAVMWVLVMKAVY
jgi:hypothetical protein